MAILPGVLLRLVWGTSRAYFVFAGILRGERIGEGKETRRISRGRQRTLRIISCHQGQSCAQPSQMRRAFPMPLPQSRPESCFIAGQVGIIVPDGEDDVHAPQSRDRFWVLLVGDKASGVVEVDVVVGSSRRRSC